MVERKLSLHFKALNKAMSNSQQHLEISDLMIDDSYDMSDFNYMPCFPMEQIPKSGFMMTFL